MTIPTFFYTCTVSVVALLSTSAEAAEQADAAGPSEIVVTAQGRQEKLKDVPISASVIPGDALQRGDIRNLEDIAAKLPSIRIAQAPGTDILRIRGVGSGTNLGFEQSVATFVDGIYRGRARASRATLFDIDRVELLRGPQTTFFGNNAIGGALNITTRKPSGDFAYNGTVLYAPTDGEYDVEGGIDVPVTEQLAVRAAAKLSGMNGYVHNNLVDNKGPRLRDRAGRLSASWKPESRISVGARLDVSRLRDKGIWNAEAVNCPPDPAYGAARGVCARSRAASGGMVDDKLDYHTKIGDSYFRYKMVEGEIATTVDLDNASLMLRTGYFDHNYDQFLSIIPFANASVTGTTSGGSSITQEKYRSFSQEVRLQSKTGGFLDWMVGGYYAKSRLAVDTAIGLYYAPLGATAPGFTATTPIAAWTHVVENTETLSSFGAATLHLAPAFRINLGLRYSSVRIRASRSAEAGSTAEDLDYGSFVPGSAAAQAILLPSTGTPIGNYADPHRTDTKLMPSASVQYEVTPLTMAYASYSKGFKAGGYAVQVSASTFDPETVDAYEVGVKSALFDRRLQLNVAGFISKYSNLQEAVSVASGVSIVSNVTNVGRSTQKGVEANATLNVTPQLQLQFDGSYLISRYDSYPNGGCTVLQGLTPGCVQDLAGKRGAFAPKWSGSTGFAFTQPLTSSLQARLDANVFYSSRFFQASNADPLLVQPGYAKVDARLAVGRADGHWEAAIIGKNLTDRTTASFRQVVPSSPGTIQALTDRPRSVALQFSFKY